MEKITKEEYKRASVDNNNMLGFYPAQLLAIAIKIDRGFVVTKSKNGSAIMEVYSEEKFYNDFYSLSGSALVIAKSNPEMFVKGTEADIGYYFSVNADKDGLFLKISQINFEMEFGYCYNNKDYNDYIDKKLNNGIIAAASVLKNLDRKTMMVYDDILVVDIHHTKKFKNECQKLINVALHLGLSKIKVNFNGWHNIALNDFFKNKEMFEGHYLDIVITTIENNLNSKFDNKTGRFIQKNDGVSDFVKKSFR